MRALILSSFVLASTAARAQGQCQAEAERGAIDYVRVDFENSKMDPGELTVTESFFVEKDKSVIYYGVLVTSRHQENFNVNVGLTVPDCEVVHTNYVVDDGD